MMSDLHPNVVMAVLWLPCLIAGFFLAKLVARTQTAQGMWMFGFGIALYVGSFFMFK